jgi:methionyl-tRNA formyltransferase
MKVIFAGTPAFAVPTLQALLNSDHEVVAVYTQPDRKAGRGQKLSESPVKQIAQAAGVPVYQPVSLKTTEAAQQLAAFAADVMVVAAYGLILPADILAIPKYGCINVHASLLPRWRGAAPIQAAILAGDTATGVTIMQMDVGLDTGAMWLKHETSIARHETAGALTDRLAQMGGPALLQVLCEQTLQDHQPEPQDEALATYAPKMKKSEAAIDWQLPAEVLLRQVRAYNPWPVSFCQWQGQPLRVWAAKLLPGGGQEPGTILAVDRQGIHVATGQAVLCITCWQRPGKRQQQAAEVLADFVQVGDQLQ